MVGYILESVNYQKSRDNYSIIWQFFFIRAFKAPLPFVGVIRLSVKMVYISKIFLSTKTVLEINLIIHSDMKFSTYLYILEFELKSTNLIASHLLLISCILLQIVTTQFMLPLAVALRKNINFSCFKFTFSLNYCNSALHNELLFISLLRKFRFLELNI